MYAALDLRKSACTNTSRNPRRSPADTANEPRKSLLALYSNTIPKKVIRRANEAEPGGRLVYCNTRAPA